MIKLVGRHLEKLAIITELPLEKITELQSMGLLNEERAVELLTKHDWAILKVKQADVAATHRIAKIAQEYDITSYQVMKAVTKKGVKQYVCKKCGKEIPKSEYSRNKGVCDNCIIASLEI